MWKNSKSKKPRVGYNITHLGYSSIWVRFELETSPLKSKLRGNVAVKGEKAKKTSGKHPFLFPSVGIIYEIQVCYSVGRFFFALFCQFWLRTLRPLTSYLNFQWSMTHKTYFCFFKVTFALYTNTFGIETFDQNQTVQV